MVAVAYPIPGFTPRTQSLRGPTGIGTNGQVLTSDGSGGTSWEDAAGGVSDHGALTGLGDDDHSIYALLAGRAGGQTIYGGTASGEVLTLTSTSHSTKGYVSIGGQWNAGTGAALAVPTGIYTPGWVWAAGGFKFNSNASLQLGNSSTASVMVSALQVVNGGPVLYYRDANTLKAETSGAALGQIEMRSQNFTTAARPVVGNTGRVIYDTTLGIPLWDNGTEWRDAAGNVV